MHRPRRTLRPICFKNQGSEAPGCFFHLRKGAQCPWVIGVGAARRLPRRVPPPPEENENWRDSPDTLAIVIPFPVLRALKETVGKGGGGVVPGGVGPASFPNLIVTAV